MTGLTVVLRNDCCLVLTDWSGRVQFQTWEPKMCLSSITAAESCEPGDRQPWASKKVRILTTSTYLPATPRQQLGCWLLGGPGRLLRLSPSSHSCFQSHRGPSGVKILRPGERERVVVTWAAVSWGWQEYLQQKHEISNWNWDRGDWSDWSDWTITMIVTLRHWGWPAYKGSDTSTLPSSSAPSSPSY